MDNKKQFLKENEMKIFKYAVIGFVSIFCLTVIVSSKVEASDYLGDFCWQFTPTLADPGVPNFIVKLGVFEMGGGHYLLGGKGGHGNAKIDGNNVLVTLTVSAAGGGTGGNDMMVGTYNITLDISTLGGTLAAIAHNHEDTDALTIADHNYFKGTMTFIPCP
jgi:hypothetical protein